MPALLSGSMRSGRDLIDPGLFDRLVAKVDDSARLGPELSARVVDQALAFLACSVRGSGQSMTPSRLVDLGWHVFLLYTREYAQFCERVAGGFIHHVPHDTLVSGASSAAVDTLSAIEAAGYRVDHELWAMSAGRCGSCHEDGNCRASGEDGNENSDNRGK
ncbi:hypothetical protein [Actinokineospora sp. NBRC 105648]|uniref:glycine-rich domain-containing protein n=1 Tax=Actinokineospora sp. NBRC 105648 TaxID=3032206 RepID=UPI00249FA774|nr:hypothetical protein [Actinokineospora sp. NBRC 105648]GLZ43300.1 hypothetical protein Acsp05_69240 [Actinokineospora sp. NBRC 105648]